MEQNVKKLIAMAAGQNRNYFDQNSIPSDIRDKVDGALDSIFRGKSMLIWIRGGKLGVAWESAMNELRNEIFAIKNTAPIVEYLRIAVFTLRNQWKAKTLQSNERNSVANVSGNELADLQSYANSLIESGTKVINDLINTTVSTNFEHKPQQTLSKNMEHTSSREYQYTRKRT